MVKIFLCLFLIHHQSCFPHPILWSPCPFLLCLSHRAIVSLGTPASSSCQLQHRITDWHAIRVRLTHWSTLVMSFPSHWSKSQSHSSPEFSLLIFFLFFFFSYPESIYVETPETFSISICPSSRILHPSKRINPISVSVCGCGNLNLLMRSCNFKARDKCTWHANKRAYE